MGTSLNIFFLVLCFTKRMCVSDTAAQISNRSSETLAAVNRRIWRELDEDQQAAYRSLCPGSLNSGSTTDRSVGASRIKLAKVSGTTGAEQVCFGCSSL